MKKKILAVILCAAAALSLFTGCGGKNDKKKEIKVHALKSELDDGNFYIRHSDGTFDSVIPTEEKDSVVWFRDDFNDIPHLVLGQGDTLVYYSTKDLGNGYTFQRYYDTGYSVGIRGLTVTKSGRYSIKVDDTSTYPKSDADELLNTDTKTVVIDAVGDKQLRYKEGYVPDSTSTATTTDDETAADEGDTNSKGDGVSSAMVTKYGTIKNLEYNKLYTLYTYAGSIRKTVNLTSDVRILGDSGDKYKSQSYTYDKKDADLIEVGIPNWFNSGYYTVSTSAGKSTAKGIFCFVNGNSYDENTVFNNPNIKPDDEDAQGQTNISDNESSDTNQTDADSYDSYADVTFDTDGYATITLSIDGMTEEEEQSMAGFRAGFFVDSATKIDFIEESTGEWVVRSNVTAGTSYRIGYSGLPSEFADRMLVNYEIN